MHIDPFLMYMSHIFLQKFVSISTSTISLTRTTTCRLKTMTLPRKRHFRPDYRGIQPTKAPEHGFQPGSGIPIRRLTSFGLEVSPSWSIPRIPEAMPRSLPIRSEQVDKHNLTSTNQIVAL